MSHDSPSKRRVLRNALHLARMLLMLALLAATAQLVVWNRNTDPRFYRFLGTSPGKWLADVMNWPNLHAHRPQDKPEEEFTDEERLWKRKLEDQIRSSWPSHVLTLRDGSRQYVRVISRSNGGLRVQEHFGGKGRVETFISRRQIVEERPYTQAPPRVTWRDVRFQMEYPDFYLAYFGHYTVLTDAPYYQVESSLKALEELRTQYMELFGDLVRFPKPDQGLQVLFFSNEEQYRLHQESTAPHLATSAGYYSPLEDRMVVFNQFHSDRARDVRREVQAKIDAMLANAKTRADRRHILRMQSAVEEQIRARGKLETIATLRHEGAHHLGYTHGVHSWIHAENAWLVEGSAVYFEPGEPGHVPLSHVSALITLSREGRLPRLEDLMAVRMPAHFEEDLPRVSAVESYALSWTLFHFCMKSQHREAFKTYLRGLQDPEHVETLMNRPRIERLADALGLASGRELEAAWREHLARF